MTSRSEADRTAALDAMLDRETLRDIAMRYSRAIDRRDWDLLRSIYHPDAIDHHGTVFCGSIDGFIEALPTLMGDYELTNHYIANCSYRLDGDRADGELYFIAYHRTRGPDARHAIVTGRYLDNYERRGGEWKIARRALVWDTVMTLDAAPADLALLATLGETGRLADDHSYAVLPLMGRGR